MTDQVNVQGYSSVTLEVDYTGRAAHVVGRGIETQPGGGTNGGQYRIGTQTGLITAGQATAGQLFQVRVADPVKLFILQKFTIQCSTATGFAATTVGAPLELIVGHSTSANGSGGSAVTVGAGNNRMRQTHATSMFNTSGNIRVATTTNLTAATGEVLESTPIGSCAGADNRTLVSTPSMVLFDAATSSESEHPLILAAGDSLVLRTNAPAATGTYFVFITMDWAEAVSY